MKFAKWILAACLCAGSHALIAQNQEAADAEAAAIYAEKSQPQPSSRELVEAARSDFLERTGLQLGTQNPKKAYIGWGMASVSVDPSNPAWARARVMAYENALLNARAEFIKFQFNNILTESTRSLFEDSSYNLPPEPAAQPDETEGALRKMFRKLIALGDAKLNEKLIEAGLDPEDFDDVPAQQREDLFAQKLLQRTLVSSYGSLAGLMVLQSFEGNDDSGHHNIGVLVVYSESFRQFAKDILEGQGAIRSDKAGKPLAAQVPKDPEMLSRQFGVRRFYNEKGLPVLVAYGQWSVMPRGSSERSLERMRENALRMARSQADAALALFVNGNLVLQSESVTGEIIEEYLLKDRTGMVESVENVGFLSVLNEQVQQRAQINISGLTDYHTFTYKHPEYDQEILGVVRVWDVESHQTATQLRTGKAPEKESERQVKYGEAGVKESGPTMDVNDF